MSDWLPFLSFLGTVLVLYSPLLSWRVRGWAADHTGGMIAGAFLACLLAAVVAQAVGVAVDPGHYRWGGFHEPQ